MAVLWREIELLNSRARKEVRGLQAPRSRCLEHRGEGESEPMGAQGKDSEILRDSDGQGRRHVGMLEGAAGHSSSNMIEVGIIFLTKANETKTATPRPFSNSQAWPHWSLLRTYLFIQMRGEATGWTDDKASFSSLNYYYYHYHHHHHYFATLLGGRGCATRSGKISEEL